MNKKAQGGWGIFLGILFLFCLVLFFSSCETVPAGSVGVKDTFGQVDDQELEPGFYVLNPFTDVVPMSTQIQKATYENVVGISKDSQEIIGEVTVNYRLPGSKASDMYKNVGSRGYVEIIGQPIIIGIIKSEFAKYPATEYATNWETLRTQIALEVTQRLGESGIVVTEVSITDFDFTKKFNEALDAQAAAFAAAKEAENKARQTITEAEARKTSTQLSADAYAYSVKVQADSDAYALRVVRQELEQSPQLIQYNMVKQWNGQLPTVTTSSDGTFFNMPLPGVN